MLRVQSEYTTPSVRIDPETGEPEEIKKEYVTSTDIKRLMEAVRIKDDVARRVAGMPTQFSSKQTEVEEDPEQVYIIGARGS
jgi:hypothetical protein